MRKNIGSFLTFVTLLTSIILFLASSWSCQNNQTIRPSAPTNFTVTNVSSTQIDLAWEDKSNNELGFRIFRDGKPIGKTEKNIKVYVDVGLKPSTNYEYELVAFNNAGDSEKVTLKVMTTNPRITVWLNQIGVIDNGEDWFRELDFPFGNHGEIFIGVIIKDGIQIHTKELRLPAKGYYKLPDNSLKDVNVLLFTTDGIGDYLNINIIGFEHDVGGRGDDLLSQAFDDALTKPDPLKSIILHIAGLKPTDKLSDIKNLKDDYLGEYFMKWSKSDNWGVGTYEDIKLDMDKGVGLRLSFTIRQEK